MSCSKTQHTDAGVRTVNLSPETDIPMHDQYGDWLKAIPVGEIGNRLDKDFFSIGVAIRHGLQICRPHLCRCVSMIDTDGVHPLICRYSAGRFTRYSAPNDIIKRVLDAVGTHSVLKPVGLHRGDGRRSGGITVFPFLQDKSLMWDASCSDTIALTLITASSAFSR